MPPRLIEEFALVEGASVTGPVAQGRSGRELAGVTAVCGLPPAAYRARTPFAQLVAVDPTERFHLGAGGDVAMRAVDLLAPIGKGTRGLIVAPPKAGKTTVLEQIARAIRAERPAARIVVLLIDERPEELTYFRRTVAAEVFASSSDQSPAEHTALAELLLAHIRTELECGNDIVVLLDSLTRLARAFNLRSSGAGRSLSGGMDASALEIPRRFFGLARNVENGGSVTLLATVLVSTGSRMDDLIYEEFKSTGNSEIVLDRGAGSGAALPGDRRAPHRHTQGGTALQRRRDGASVLVAPNTGRLRAPSGADTSAEAAGAVSNQRRAAAAYPAGQIRDRRVSASLPFRGLLPCGTDCYGHRNPILSWRAHWRS